MADTNWDFAQDMLEAAHKDGSCPDECHLCEAECAACVFTGAYARQQFRGECECWLEDHDARPVGCRDTDEGGEA